jgi:hypothetical protein
MALLLLLLLLLLLFVRLLLLLTPRSRAHLGAERAGSAEAGCTPDAPGQPGLTAPSVAAPALAPPGIRAAHRGNRTYATAGRARRPVYPVGGGGETRCVRASLTMD